MTFAQLGILGVLAAFGIGSIGASALVLAVWRLAAGPILRMPPAARARLLLALRLLPTAAGTVASLGLVLPAYVLLEPRGAGEEPGVTLWVFALAGLAAAARGIWSLSTALFATGRVVRAWSRKSTPVSLSGVACRVYRVETSAPIVALAGARIPRLFIAGSVLDGCGSELVSAMAAHELGHWRSGDNVKRLMLEGAADPLPLLPSGRRILEAWDSASEEAADDEAIASGARPEDLAESLVRVARLAPAGTFPEAAGAAAFYRGEAFERRVRRLLAAPAVLARAASRRPAGAIVGLLAATGGLAAASAVLEPVHRFFELVVHAP